jgi:branched-chain amino acid aminotransferase
LDGSILPGVTRDSILKLTKSNYPEVEVQERPFSIDEFFETYKKGNLVEVFMSGTAAVVSPVN